MAATTTRPRQAPTGLKTARLAARAGTGKFGWCLTGHHAQCPGGTATLTCPCPCHGGTR